MGPPMDRFMSQGISLTNVANVNRKPRNDNLLVALEGRKGHQQSHELEAAG